METVELKGVFRKEVGKKFSRKLREEEKVPCVIYGGENIKHFSVLEKEVKSIIYTEKVYLLKINLDGGNYNAILQDIQFHGLRFRGKQARADVCWPQKAMVGQCDRDIQLHKRGREDRGTSLPTHVHLLIGLDL